MKNQHKSAQRFEQLIEDPMMEQAKALNVAIVGGGPGCKAIMDIIFAEKLSQLRMKLIGVACRNPKAVGYLYAKEKGIYTTTDYRDLFKLKDLHMIIEVTGSDEVEDEISRTKPPGVKLMDHVAALVFWDVFHIEEQRIAERKRSAEASKIAHAELNQIFETSVDGMRVVGRDFNGLRVNETFALMAGMKKEEISGKTCYEVFPGPLCHTPKCPLTRLLGGEETIQCEVEKERHDGTKISCIVTATPFRDSDGEMIGIVEEFRDISERKEAEEALRESEEKFRALVESSIDGIVVVQENRIAFANQKTLKMFGCDSIGDMVGKMFTAFVSPEYHSLVMERGLAIERGQNVSSHYEFKALRKDDTRFDAEFSMSVITYQGHIARQGQVRDITERKLAEKEKKRLEVQLQRAQKMEAIGSLAGGVAHDLNNILSGIVSYPELLLMQIPEDSSLRKPILTMQESGKKAADIVQDLLTLARREVATTEVANLNDIILGYLKSPEHQKLKLYHSEVEVETDLEPNLLNVLGSPIHLSKTVMNLVSNAAEAMADSGKIAISTENRYIDRPVWGYHDVEEGDYVTLTVSDSGIGIPSEEVDRIFEPFYTKKKMGRSGTGLGMAVVWGTVKDHNGYIDVQSSEGEGTTFTLYFPATRRQPVKVQSSLGVEDYIGSGQSILVVDDVNSPPHGASLAWGLDSADGALNPALSPLETPGLGDFASPKTHAQGVDSSPP
jgi:PAS domain S-box-containing protein